MPQQDLVEGIGKAYCSQQEEYTLHAISKFCPKSTTCIAKMKITKA
jgi:hypothetical protein